MNIKSGNFTEFDRFKEVIKDWSLDFNILSKGDFKAYFKLFTSDWFLLAHEKLTGIIEHCGTSPIGFRTMVIPVNRDNEFIWFNKKVNGSDLLIFPKNNDIDVVTYDGLDVYLLSIEENLLYKIINDLNLKNCRNLFKDSEKEVFLSEAYALKFSKMVVYFLNNATTVSVKKCKNDSKFLMYSLLKYIETSVEKSHSLIKKSSSLTLLKAIDIIKKDRGMLLSIPDLCEQVRISERSLYNAFKEKYNVSPADFIKSIRLNKVREELYNNNKQVSISDIAGKYQFWHMGQFATDFKKQFGVLPSEVMKRKSD